MVCGDAGGVLVSPASASVLNLTTAAVSGRLLEPDLIALSSHGGHHLFINRIPPRLPKEDVEKIILSQLRLHPFVLQVSKCSVIPQNSLKNKGYGFITLDGSPSPSDLDAIADSLNNKLQVGCRTLGVRVCTDCHSACYAEEEGCASSFSATPPNEPADDESSLPHEQPSAADTETNVDRPQAAAAAGGAVLAVAPGHSPARASSAPPPQLELLQTAVAVLTKQASLPAGLASGPAPVSRRRKPAKQQQQQQHDQKPSSSQPLPPQQQQHSRDHHLQQPLGHGLQQPRLSCRLGKPQGGQGSAHSATGHQRRHSGHASPVSAVSADMAPGSMCALLSLQEGFTADRPLSPAGSSDTAQPPPPLPPAMSAPVPQSHSPAVAQRQPHQEHLPPPPPPSHHHQAEVPQDGGECGGSAAVSGSPRSVSSYSSAPGSGPGSASNSAPGSVCSGHGSGSGSGSATGSGRVSGSSASGWSSREDCVDAGASPLGVSAAASLPAGMGGAPAGVAVRIPDALDSVTLLSNSVCRHVCHAVQQHHQQNNNRPQRVGSHGRGAADSAVATSMPCPPTVGQQCAAPGTAHQPQLPAQSSGSAARCSRAVVTYGPRGATAAAPVAPSPHGRAGRGQVTAAQRVPAPPPPTSQQSVCVWNAGPSASGLGPTGPSGHLHSASAPPSSSWYIHQVRQRHEHDPRRHAQQRQHQYPSAQGAYLPLRNDSGGSGRGGGPATGARDGSRGAGGVGSAGGGAGVVGGPAAGGRGLGRPRGVQPPPQQAASGAVYGSHTHGPPRSAWPDVSGGVGVDGLGAAVERSGSHPGGPAQGTPVGMPARPQPPMAHYNQQHQLPPSQQHRQQKWLAYSSGGPATSGPQVQQMAPPAYQPSLQQRQQPPQPLQQPSLGIHFAPQLQPPGLRLSQPQPQMQRSVSSLGQAPHHQQQVLQRQQGPEGPSPAQRPPAQHHQQQKQPQRPGGEPQQWQQQQRHQQQQPLSHLQQQAKQQQHQLQQQQALHAFLSHGGGGMAACGHPAASPPPLSSGCLPAASPTATPVQLLLGGAGPVGSDAFRVSSPAPLASSLPPSLVGWRLLDLVFNKPLDLEYDSLRRSARPEAAEPQLLAATAPVGSLLSLAAGAAASGVSARSAEFAFLGRGSSDGFQDVGACSVDDSADLDPLDLEPMILQLLENDDDDDGGRSGVAAAGRRDCVDSRSQHHWALAQGGPLPPHVMLQQEQRLSGAGGCVQHPLPSAVPPAPLAPPAAALQGVRGGPCSRDYHYHQRQHPQLHRQQRQQQRHQQQPQRQQAGFETGSTGASMGSAACAEAAAAWAAPRPRSDSSSNSNGSSTVGAAAAVLPATPAPPVPAAVAATPPTPGLGGHGAVALHPASTGGVLSVRERVSATSAAAGARWARARAECGPGTGLGLVGSFPDPGAGAGSYEGAAGSWHRRGGTGSGSRVAGGGGGHGGVGAGYRGARSHGGGGRGIVGPVGHGGGRGSGSREGAMGKSGSGGMALGVRMGAIAGHSHLSGGGGVGAGGGCEPQGFVSGSLPNANLLAVMQRLNA